MFAPQHPQKPDWLNPTTHQPHPPTTPIPSQEATTIKVATDHLRLNHPEWAAKPNRPPALINPHPTLPTLPPIKITNPLNQPTSTRPNPQIPPLPTQPDQLASTPLQQSEVLTHSEEAMSSARAVQLWGLREFQELMTSISWILDNLATPYWSKRRINHDSIDS